MAVNRLPSEVLTLIISLTTEISSLGRMFFPSAQCFLSCSLVCRRWLEVTQTLMYSEIELDSAEDLVLVHRTLINSDKLGDFVRQLSIRPLHSETTRLSHGQAERMLAECLEKTSHLSGLIFCSQSSQYFTKVLADRIHRLSNLKRFTFSQDSPHNTDEEYEEHDLDPVQLLALPQSVQELDFSTPSERVLEVLPNLCASLSQSDLGPGLQESRQSDKAGNFLIQSHGLRSLTLELSSTEHCQIPRVQEFYAKLSCSLSYTLSSFVLYDSPPIETEHLIKLLSATSLLEHLRLYRVAPSGDLFGALKPFTNLRTFGAALGRLNQSEGSGLEECNRFCQSLIDSISHSPHFNTFNLMCTDVPRPSSAFVGLIVCGLVVATRLDGSASLSRLRQLNIQCFGELPIDALEALCQEAPNLMELYVLLSTDDMPRIVSALRNLTELVDLQVNAIHFQRAPGQKSLNLEELLLSSLEVQ